MKEWSVAVGLGGLRTSGPTDDEQVAAIAEQLAGLAPSISVGPASLTIRVAIEAEGATSAGASAVTAVSRALQSVGLGPALVRELEVTEWPLFERKLETPTYPELVGISEIAEIFGTSRQRASELARSSKFPAPHADLAAGPVWFRPAVTRFAEEWDRKPGRPRSETAARLEARGARRRAEEEART